MRGQTPRACFLLLVCNKNNNYYFIYKETDIEEKKLGSA